jgi:predicted nucleic acid-binding protein
MKPQPDPVVKASLNNQSAETLYLPSVALAEMLFSICSLPMGKRKDMLSQVFDGLMELFEGRILPSNFYKARHRFINKHVYVTRVQSISL